MRSKSEAIHPAYLAQRTDKALHRAVLSVRIDVTYGLQRCGINVATTILPKINVVLARGGGQMTRAPERSFEGLYANNTMTQ